MRFFFIIILLLLSLPLLAQTLIKGVVKDAETNEPVIAASVFLNTTSIGTVTSNNGSFELFIPAGKYDLVITSIGYESFSQPISSTGITGAITIKLLPKTKELETVIIEPFEKDGWEKWGLFFKENFIGTSSFAKDCKIKNYKSIRFRNAKKTNQLSAVALEPLIIENNYLGYTVQYQLEQFTYNFKTKILFYQGFAFFTPMIGNTKREKIWAERREDAYHGSLMHFMRSLYRNRLLEEGFEMRSLTKMDNLEKQRIKAKYKSAFVQNSNVGFSDSSNYYNNILAQPDTYDVINKEILTGDSVAFAIDSVTAGMEFNNYLLIEYKNKKAPIEYKRSFPENGSAILSQINLINQKPVAIQANGVFYNPLDLLSSGYWSWSEKMAMMLPFDYWPSKKSNY